MRFELRYGDSYNKCLYLTDDEGNKFGFRLNTTKKKMEQVAEEFNLKFIDTNKIPFEEREEFYDNNEYRGCRFIG